MPPGGPPPDPLLEAFATYLRRVLADAGVTGAISTTSGSLGFPPDTVIGVAAGKRTDWGDGRLARRRGLVRQFSGGSIGNGAAPRRLRITIYDGFVRTSNPSVDPSFDVMAILCVFNEADIIGKSIEHLLANGVRVHVIDNWSTDRTVEIVHEFVDAGRPVTWERCPADGPTEFASWEELLKRAEAVAARSGADWVVLNDADEFRVPCWRDMTLRDALWAVEQWGYNCIDYTVLNFRPVDDDWCEGSDPTTSFPWFEFGDHPAYFLKIGTWKPPPSPVDLASSGGHEVIFEGRRIFPYKFLLRHYPIRSRAHGAKKIGKERLQRWSPEEMAKGWHQHYRLDDDRFTWDPRTLLAWSRIDEDFMLQRLSGVGLPGNLRPGEGPA